jgi:predicted  nucleic acid-binding Zn-ribbon protein
MTSEIKLYLEQIKAKTTSLHHALVTERERNASISAENQRLESLLSEQEAELNAFKATHAAALQELSEKREQAQIQPITRNDLAIDGLVKEIDFCIQQLKIANE